MHLLWMTKKKRCFPRYLIIGKRINISFLQHQSTFSSHEELFLMKSRQVPFFVILLWPLISMQNLSHPITTHILRAELLEFHIQCSWEMLTQEWEWSLFTDLILISTPYFSQATGCNFQRRSNFGVPRIQPFGSDASSSLGKVYSRQATESVNFENSSVSFVMKYCTTSTKVRNLASVQNLLNLSCCDNFSIRFPYCCNRKSWFAGTSQSKTVLITLSTSEELHCATTRGLPVLSWRFPCSSHISVIIPSKLSWLQRPLCEKKS